MWLATTLRRAGAVAAHHERIGPYGDLGQLNGGVEVNSHLRKRVAEIERVYPDADIIHLVRDGRDVVRSLLTRKPKTGFIGACKIWRDANDMLLDHDLPLARIEDLSDDFDAFANLVKTFDGAPDRMAWGVLKDTKINRTGQYLCPHWSEWEGYYTDTFWEIAGEIMTECGYDQ